jgi:nicotinamidase-related amidase
MEDSKLEFITDKNSLLLLVDFQPGMFRGIGSGDRTYIKNAAVASATAAQILDVPVVFSSISEKSNGAVIDDLMSLFPDQKAIERPNHSFDALETEEVLAAIQKTGRKKIIVSGLWTSMCFAFSALHAVREGYDVYGLIDAAGDATPDAHEYGIQRMLQAGVTPTTWMPLTSEWMHDWLNPKAGELIEKVYGRYDAMLAM